MTREEAIQVLTVIKGSKEFIQGFGTKYNNDIEAIDMAIEALHQKGVYEQTKWERDMALQTLEEYGIGLGQKAETRPSEMSVNVEYDVEYLPDKDGVHQAKATITKAEPSDLISRDKAICAIENADCELTAKDWDALIDAIEAVPSADRPKGEWIDKGEYAECSICGAHSGKQFDGVEPIPLKTPYCPNCGADMRGGTE